MKINYRHIAILLLLCCSGTLFAQKFLWNVNFDFRFDNREYHSPLTHSGTLFGAKLAPEIGIGWDNPKGGMNALKLGVDATVDFGAKPFNHLPEILLYYTYQSPKFKAYAGALPRRHMIGDYGNAFFNDSIQFYDGTIEGLLLNYDGKWGYVEAGCDWNGMYSKESREKFLIFSAAMFRYKWFRMGYAFDMYHFAGSYDVKGVVDNILIAPYVTFNVTQLVPLDTLYIKLSYLQAYQNDRRLGESPLYPKGGQIDFAIEKWGVGIRNSFYMGQNLMPYFSQYGHELYWQEDYYQTARFYNRLEVYWNPIKSDDLDLKIRTIHHWEGHHWGWQQMVTLAVRLDQGMFHSFKTTPQFWQRKRKKTTPTPEQEEITPPQQ